MNRLQSLIATATATLAETFIVKATPDRVETFATTDGFKFGVQVADPYGDYSSDSEVTLTYATATVNLAPGALHQATVKASDPRAEVVIGAWADRVVELHGAAERAAGRTTGRVHWRPAAPRH